MMDLGTCFSHRENASAKAVNQLLNEGARVYWTSDSMQVDETIHPPGTIIVENAEGVF